MKIKISIKKLFNQPDSLSEKFHQKTKIFKLNKKIESQKWPESWTKVYFKGYHRFEKIVLPNPELKNNISFKKILLRRKSSHNYSRALLSLKKISTLLYFSAGLRNNKAPFIANRFYPSAGARYPLEVYLLSCNTELPAGVYHYYLKAHCLEKFYPVSNKDIYKLFDKDTKKFIKSPCFIIITAVFKRSSVKYGDRGYRYVLIEAGHLGQNIYLNACALNISCCAIGGFIDDKFNELLDIDGLNESALYIFAIG